MPALILLKLACGRIWSFLSHRSLAQLACIALALFAGLQTIRLHGEQRHSAKVEKRSAELAKQLHDISTAKAEQRTTTSGNIVKAEAGRVKAEAVAKRIEGAVLPGECKTPSEILQADL